MPFQTTHLYDLQPFAPNHLLLQRTVRTLPPGTFVKEDMLLTKFWRQTQILADHFWRRWVKEYVPALQDRKKWHRPRRNAQVGDLVLVVDQDLLRERGFWAVLSGWFTMGSCEQLKWRPNILVVVATHTETLSVRGIREPLPWLRLIRIKNRTSTLLLPLNDSTNRFLFGNSRLTCYL